MRLFISLLALLTVFSAVPASAGPEGQMTLVLNSQAHRLQAQARSALSLPLNQRI